jgi:hypothetical protein
VWASAISKSDSNQHPYTAAVTYEHADTATESVTVATAERDSCTVAVLSVG